MKNTKRTIFLIFILFFNYTFSQVSKKVEKILKPVESYESFNVFDDETEKIERKLFKTATISELEYLSVNEKNSYIKAIAIKVLTNLDSNKAIQVFKQILNSEDSLTFRTECLSNSSLLSSYFFGNIAYHNNLTEEEREHLKQELVNIILDSGHKNLKLLEEISYSIPTVPDNYEKIRNLVIESKSSQLLITLAEYNNPNDIELIKSFGNNAFLAIEEFPDNQFLPFLKDNIQESKNFPYMFAISKFCNEESVEIVKEIIKFSTKDLENSDCGNHCLTTLYNQIYMDDCKLYYPLLSDLWLTHKILSFDILDEYENTHSKEETENFILNGLLLDGEAQLIQYNMYALDKMLSADFDMPMPFNNTSKLVNLLKKLKSFSQRSYVKALRKNLLEIVDLSTDAFIVELNDNKSIIKNSDVLIQKLKENESAYGLLIIMDGIKALKDKNLFAKCYEILKQRRAEFRETEIWEKSYQEFLKKNKLEE